MTRHTKVRALILIAIVMSLLLLVPHTGHSPGLVLGFMWVPILLFAPVDFRRTLPRAGYVVEYVVSPSLGRAQLFQRPPPLI
jgi:hypothetical protein